MLVLRVSDGSVFSDDASFQIFVGQAEEFPLLQAPTNPIAAFVNCTVNSCLLANGGCFIFQARHLPVSPGKKHTVEVSGSHLTTSKNPASWKFEGKV